MGRGALRALRSLSAACLSKPLRFHKDGTSSTAATVSGRAGSPADSCRE